MLGFGKDKGRTKTVNKNKGKNKGGAKYTRLTVENIRAILDRAAENAGPFICKVDFDERAGLIEISEHDERPGTFFIDYVAETWREAAAFQAAVIGAAWALGHFAEAGFKWNAGVEDGEDGGRRLVDVFIAAADYVDAMGCPVA